MRTTLFYVQMLFLMTLLFISCSDNTEDRIKINQHIQKMEFSEVMEEIFLETDDVEQLTRILGCSPSTINRLRKSETAPTEKAENAFKNLLIEMKLSGNTEEYLEKIDPENDYWFHSIKWFFCDFYVLNVIFCIVIVLGGISLLTGEGEGLYLIIAPILVWGIVWCINWLWGLFYEIEIIDNFTVAIDSLWEVLV